MIIQELFDNYRHYGTIEKREDYFNFYNNDIFATMLIITWADTTRLFILRNGKAVYTEKIRKD